MSSTPSEGPPSAGPPHARASDHAASDPAALLQHQRAAECELADALARFQAEVCPAAEMSLPAVVEAARGAFRLGFAYTSCRGLDPIETLQAVARLAPSAQRKGLRAVLASFRDYGPEELGELWEGEWLPERWIRTWSEELEAQGAEA